VQAGELVQAPEPKPDCRLHPDVEVGPSRIANNGLFTR
jgi:hypothetical protein